MTDQYLKEYPNLKYLQWKGELWAVANGDYQKIASLKKKGVEIIGYKYPLYITLYKVSKSNVNAKNSKVGVEFREVDKGISRVVLINDSSDTSDFSL